MTYEVYTSATLSHYIGADILHGEHACYYSSKLAEFDEVHVIEYRPDGLACMGVGDKVIIDLTWVDDMDNPHREARLKCLVGYLDRYSEVFHEALRVYQNMVGSGIEPNKDFFKYYADILADLGRKMRAC